MFCERVAGERSRMPLAPETSSTAPASATMLPETAIAPPASTDPIRRPYGSGVSKTRPAADKTLRGPRSTVGSGSVWPFVLVVGNELAPPIVMLPPGAMMEPRTVTVSPLMVTLAIGSVWITAPAPMKKSPRRTVNPVKSSFVPEAPNARLTGIRRPSGFVNGFSTVLPPLPRTASQLTATGRMIVSGAIIMAGRNWSEPERFGLT